MRNIEVTDGSLFATKTKDDHPTEKGTLHGGGLQQLL